MAAGKREGEDGAGAGWVNVGKKDAASGAARANAGKRGEENEAE